jgi:selenium metabolism protein YedF
MENHNTVILINKEGMGSADRELQHRLIKTYLQLLDANQSLPAAICIYAEGVNLVVEGSPVLEELQGLQTKGVHIISCLTCLDYYNLTDRLKVGVIGGMSDILEAQLRAAKTITL